MKTSKDFEDMSDFADWIMENGEFIDKVVMGPAIEKIYRVDDDFYTIVVDYWTEKPITVLEPEL